MVTLISTDQRTDRARRRASSYSMDLPTMGGWRAPSAFGPCGTTGLASGVVDLANHTTGANGQTIERPARHLGTRST